ncbi:glycerophosphodiester phosphodiesterase [Butyrivibrio sp. WCD2001]|uniref:glycerophosphodiester phosphodiesterase n=1 Tax=Butyrivibrio sp. WCD2001 TaxID=1280681 RepID=UPI0004262922|nr:glycerophosphodiester phosphodiesterase [Butyrivibrio sp. WCD2001]
MKIWAHRGASGYAPENTIPAFKMAVDMKADGVELDVQMTRDGHLVVIHDEKIDRTSNGTGFVRDYTLEELRQFDFSKTHPECGRADIPLLEEVYDLLKDTGMTINVEFKTGIIFYEGIEERVLELTERMGMQDRVWYSSFNHYTIKRLNQMRNNLKTGILYVDGIYEPYNYAETVGAIALHPSVNNLKYPEVVQKAHEKGQKVHVWTVNTEDQMKLCAELGVDAVIGNYPNKAREYFAE